jgi:hypothetical protein
LKLAIQNNNKLLLINYFRLFLNNRRKGELLMAISGLGIAIGSGLMGIPQLSYAGLCITGLGFLSMIWR